MHSTQSPESVWIKLENTLKTKGGNSTTVIGAVYLPPLGSTCGLGALESFAWLQDQVMKVSDIGPILLAGDFNARVGNEQEPSLVLDTDLLDLPQLPPQNIIDAPLRLARDSSINEFGQELLPFCAMTDMLILNGRLPGDIPGNFTYKSKALQGENQGWATLDYFLASPDLMDENYSTLNLTVRLEDAFRLHSDHYPLCLKIPGGSQNQSPHNQPSRRRRRRKTCPQTTNRQWVWDESKKSAYESELQSGVASISLASLLHESTSEAVTCIDFITQAVNQAAEHAFLNTRPMFSPPVLTSGTRVQA